ARPTRHLHEPRLPNRRPADSLGGFRAPCPRQRVQLLGLPVFGGGLDRLDDTNVVQTLRPGRPGLAIVQDARGEVEELGRELVPLREGSDGLLPVYYAR